MCIYIRITVKHLAEYLQRNGGTLNNIDGFSELYYIYYVLKRSAQVHDLLSNNSLFVSQLYEYILALAQGAHTSLQLTSITKQFTARVDLFLKHMRIHVYIKLHMCILYSS